MFEIMWARGRFGFDLEMKGWVCLAPDARNRYTVGQMVHSKQAAAMSAWASRNGATPEQLGTPPPPKPKRVRVKNERKNPPKSRGGGLLMRFNFRPLVR